PVSNPRLVLAITGPFADCLLYVKPRKQGVGIIGLEDHGMPEAGNRLAQPLLESQCVTKIDERRRVPRLKPQGLSAVEFGLFQTPEGGERSAKIVVRLRVFRVQAQGLAAAGLRFTT